MNIMMNNQDQLKIISNCPVCDSRNFPSQIKVLQEKDNSHLLYVQCRRCKSRVIVLITAHQNGISSVGLLTDLSSDEVLKFSTQEPINHDDVLELYDSLFEKKEKFFELI